MPPVFVILHNVRSIYNVGSIFRTAETIGVTKLYLTGYTPTPVDRFGRKRGDLSKVALGAEDSVPWEYFKNLDDLVVRFKKDGVHVVAVEQSSDAHDYKSFRLGKPTAFIFGNETDGLSKKELVLCDACIAVPMAGKKESLNVSVCAGIVLYHVLDVS